MMDNAQFKELCDRMKIGRSLTYTDFLDHFQRTATQEYKDHRVKVGMVATCALYALFKADALHALFRY